MQGLKICLALSCIVFVSAVSADKYQNHPQAQNFIAAMVDEHQFSEAELVALFDQVEKKTSILEAISRPAEKTLTWGEYRKIFIVPSRINKGVAFWRDNATLLQQAEDQYGVPPEIVVAVIGVETRYGGNKGSYRVMDALSTLAFDYPPRASFFRKELEHFLLLARDQKRNPLDLKGSYAGAMGYGQFMPSSYRSYAVDFDGDNFIDIWDNRADAIGSVANYLHRHGWQREAVVAVRSRVTSDHDASVISNSLKPNVILRDIKSKGFEPVAAVADSDEVTVLRLEGDNGAEFWLGLKNFYVITRYNHSVLYAMAVYQLGEAIKQAHVMAAE